MSFNFAQNAVDPDEFKSYNEYVSLNASLIKGVIWKVTGAKQFDWIQINSQRLNGYNGDYKIKVF